MDYWAASGEGMERITEKERARAHAGWTLLAEFSESIGHGMLIERINMPCITRRLPKDGGKQEGSLAKETREQAKTHAEWPRTSHVLKMLADQ